MEEKIVKDPLPQRNLVMKHPAQVIYTHKLKQNQINHLMSYKLVRQNDLDDF